MVAWVSLEYKNQVECIPFDCYLIGRLQDGHRKLLCAWLMYAEQTYLGADRVGTSDWFCMVHLTIGYPRNWHQFCLSGMDLLQSGLWHLQLLSQFFAAQGKLHRIDGTWYTKTTKLLALTGLWSNALVILRFHFVLYRAVKIRMFSSWNLQISNSWLHLIIHWVLRAWNLYVWINLIVIV